VGDQQCAFGDLVERRGLVGGVHGADGDAVHAAGQEVIEQLLLLGRAAGGGHTEEHLDVTQFAGGVLRAAPGQRPEVRRGVGHKGQAQFPGRPGFARTAADDTDCNDCEQRYPKTD